MKLLICFFIAGISLSACKKSGGGNNWRLPMIKTETVDNYTTTYFYDKEGRAVKAESTGTRNELTYTGDSLHIKTTELSTNVVQKRSGKLNANGRLISDGGTEYNYDADDRLIETAFPPNSNGWRTWSKNYYNNATGLLDSTRQLETSLVQTRWKQTIIYTYYTDLAETHGNENRGLGFWGKNSLRPLKHSETWSPIAAAPYRKITYTTDDNYGYDDAGRIAVEDHREVLPDGTHRQRRTVYTYY